MGIKVGKLLGDVVRIAGPVVITAAAGGVAGLIVKEGGKLAAKAARKSLAERTRGG